jgi:hypothetical protein
METLPKKTNTGTDNFTQVIQFSSNFTKFLSDFLGMTKIKMNYIEDMSVR